MEEERGYDATLNDTPTEGAPATGIGSVTGYAAAGKAKARTVCQAFVDGAGGGRVLQPGAAVFFGVTEPSQHLWHQARREGVDWYYLDNAYFDAARGHAFRAVRNAVQARGDEPPDWPRFARLGLRIMPWRRSGRHVLLVVQSATHMEVVAGRRADWWREALKVLAHHTDRPVVVRGWRSNKMALASTLASGALHAQTGTVNAICSTDQPWCELAAREFTRATGAAWSPGRARRPTKRCSPGCRCSRSGLVQHRRWRWPT